MILKHDKSNQKENGAQRGVPRAGRRIRRNFPSGQAFMNPNSNRRQTMIASGQIVGADEAAEGNKRRRTIIEEESPEERSAFAPQKPASEPKSGVPATQRFSPRSRPPMAKLFVLDDSGIDAEVIRIRNDRFTIGREVGDLVVSHDGQMSGAHAEVRRMFKDGQWRWYVIDLESTNGLFVRVTEVPLEDGLEVWLGGRSYRFEDGLGKSTPQDTIMPPSTGAVSGTIVASAPNLTPHSAALTEISAGGTGNQYILNEDGYWIGRDPARCQVVIDDPMLGSQDTYAFLDDEGKWGLRKGKSLNGIWARVDAVPLIGDCLQFQCGEQRFALRVD